MLTDVEEEVLIELHDVGNLSPSILGDRTGHDSKHISRRLRSLEDDGLVANLGGVWTLTLTGTRAAQALLRDRE